MIRQALTLFLLLPDDREVGILGFQLVVKSRVMIAYALEALLRLIVLPDHGLVGRKALFNGGMLESEINEAEAEAAVRLSQIKLTYRSGARSVQAALQNIKSMEKAIIIAKENAKLTADEIVHLRQQLIIGGSTLDSVLSAEARLYEAESKEIKFLTEKYKSEVLVVSSLGLLSRALGY